MNLECLRSGSVIDLIYVFVIPYSAGVTNGNVGDIMDSVHELVGTHSVPTQTSEWCPPGLLVFSILFFGVAADVHKTETIITIFDVESQRVGSI